MGITMYEEYRVLCGGINMVCEYEECYCITGYVGVSTGCGVEGLTGYVGMRSTGCGVEGLRGYVGICEYRVWCDRVCGYM